MRRSSFSTFAVSFIALLAIAVGPAAAEEKKAKEGQLNGMVKVLNKQTSMITIRKGGVERTIVYNGSTQFQQGTEGKNKPSSIDEMKEGWYVNCKGTFDGAKLVATACRFREERNTTQR